MATVMNKDPFTYEKEYASFLQDLKQFHTARGTPFRRVPQIAGRDVDLYLLYSKVTALGGWNKVNNELRWEDIQEDFHIPRACSNSAQALKRIYLRYLDLYEKVHLHGEDPDSRVFEDEDETSRLKKRNSAPINTVPSVYNHHQHDIPKRMRLHMGLSTNLRKKSDYENLEKSLLSCLPNEVDFAINVCTLLSNEGRHTLQLDRAPRLINLLLAHAGVFSIGPGSLFEPYTDTWKVMKRHFVKFWYDCVEDKEVRNLIVDLPSTDKLVEDSSSELELFNLGRELGVTDAEGQRILQLAIIIRNLSFEKENCSYLAGNMTVFRFLMLCSHCKHSCLKQVSLDTIGNLALQFIMEPIQIFSTQLVLRLVTRCLASDDKFEIVRGMEILGNLCQVEENEETLGESLEEKNYIDIVNKLTVQDIQLIVATLEVLYQLSELGEVTTTHIASVKTCVDILLNLMTIEAQSYGPGALVGIKVVEHADPDAVAVPQQAHPPQQAATLTPRQPQPMRPFPGPHATPPPQQAMQHQQTTQQHTNRPVVRSMPQPQHSTPQVVLPQEMDNEGLACSWLRSFYEPCPGQSVGRTEFYAEYLQCCNKLAKGGLLNIAHFTNMIKVVFPKLADVCDQTTSEIRYGGVRRRANPLPFPPRPVRTVHPHQASPSPVPNMRGGPGPLRQQQQQQQHFNPQEQSGSNWGMADANQSRPPTPNHSSAMSQQQQQQQQQQGQGPGGVGRMVGPGGQMSPQQLQRMPMSPTTPDGRSISVSVLQQQLSTPPQNSPVFKPQQQQQQTQQQQQQGSPNQYPSIQHALLNSSNPGSPQQQQQTQQHQHNFSQTPTGRSAGQFKGMKHNKKPDTNLIKSLLANKIKMGPNGKNKFQQQLNQHNLGQQQGQMEQNFGQNPMSPQQIPQQQQQQQSPQQQPPQQQMQQNWQQQQQQQQLPQQQPVMPPSQQQYPSAPQYRDNRYDPQPPPVSSDFQPLPQYFQQQNTQGSSSGNYNSPPPYVAQHNTHNFQNDQSQNQSPWRAAIGAPANSKPKSPVRSRSPSRSKSPSRSSTPQCNSPSLPQSPRCKSPRSCELAICSRAERAQDIVSEEDSMHEALIERVENPRCAVAEKPMLQESCEVQIERVENHSIQDLATKNSTASKNDGEKRKEEPMEGLTDTHKTNDNSKSNASTKLPGEEGMEVDPPQVEPPVTVAPSIKNEKDSSEINTTQQLSDINKHKEHIEKPEAHIISDKLRTDFCQSMKENTMVNGRPTNGDSIEDEMTQIPIKELKEGRDTQDSVTATKEEQKRKLLNQVLEEKTIKEQLVMNGIVNHIGNGDCLLEEKLALKDPVLGLDRTSKDSDLFVGRKDVPDLTRDNGIDDLRDEKMKEEELGDGIREEKVNGHVCHNSPPKDASVPPEHVQNNMKMNANLKSTVDSSGVTVGNSHNNCLDGLETKHNADEKAPPSILVNQLLSGPPTPSSKPITNVSHLGNRPVIIIRDPAQQQQQQQETNAELTKASIAQPVPNSNSINPSSAESASAVPSATIVTWNQAVSSSTSSSASSELDNHNPMGTKGPSVPGVQLNVIAQPQVQVQGAPVQMVLPVQGAPRGPFAGIGQVPVQVVQQIQVQGAPQVTGSGHPPNLGIHHISTAPGAPVQFATTQGGPQIMQQQQQPSLQHQNPVQMRVQGESQIPLQRAAQISQQGVGSQPAMSQAPRPGVPQQTPLVQTVQQVPVQGAQVVSSVQRAPPQTQVLVHGAPLVQIQQQSSSQQGVQQVFVQSSSPRMPVGGATIQKNFSPQGVTGQLVSSQGSAVVFHTTSVVVSSSSSSSSLPVVTAAAAAPLIGSPRVAFPVQSSIVPPPVPPIPPLDIEPPTPPPASPAVSQPSVVPPMGSPPIRPSSPASSKRALGAVSPQPAKRTKSGSVDSRRSSNASQGGPEYMCEWCDCRRLFENAKAVFKHIVKSHLTGQEGHCQWEGCDGLRRQKWSLVTHVQDRHCTEQTLKAAVLRRQQLAQMGMPQPTPKGPPTPLPPPVYPPDAALQAIRRYVPRPPYQEFLEAREGPVTKHIRFTSALILRNLARYSSTGRSILKRHERHLAYVALSGVEASTPIANCLWELQHDH